MRLKLTQLDGSLKRGLAPVYLITGDEPLQIGEAADSIRLAAKNRSYLNREVFTVEGNFNWNQISQAADSLSIFADKKIIDLRVPSGKFGKDGAKVLSEYCKQPPEDTILLISSAKLTSASTKSRWFQTIDKAGVVIQVWPLAGQELIAWLRQRLLKRGLQLEIEAVKILASRIEGNLLAAAQEIEKLYVLYGTGRLSTQQVQEVVADSSRFDVFNLSDALLGGRVNRIIKILQGLQAEGIAAPIVLWVLSKDLRCLLELKTASNKEQVFRKHQIWDKRKHLMNNALSRLNLTELQQAVILSAKADRQIKGQQTGDSWETLLQICLLMTSIKVFS
ncbi:MAG: DNA polymerase III subunit delta [Methylococcaceae bacterium]|nr:DNA polymerase III subunit delta [Methylococcaceae bacterium]